MSNEVFFSVVAAVVFLVVVFVSAALLNKANTNSGSKTLFAVFAPNLCDAAVVTIDGKLYMLRTMP
jgi:hypothetical protein